MGTTGPGIGVFEDPRFYEALGRAIKAVRAQRGLGRRRLAELADLSYPYLSEIENGKKRPSSKALLSIADALALSASQLLAIAEGFASYDDGAPAYADKPSRPESSVERSMEPVQPAPSVAPPPSREELFLSARGAGASLRRASKAIEELRQEDIGAVPPRPSPEFDFKIEGAGRRQRARARLAMAADQLTIEDLERLADLAERLAR